MRPLAYCSFAYSALACFRMGMSGSASFQKVREPWKGARPAVSRRQKLAPADVFGSLEPSGAPGRQISLRHQSLECSTRFRHLGQTGAGILEVQQERLIFVHGLVTLTRSLVELAQIEVAKQRHER